MYLKSLAACLCLTAAPALAEDLVFDLINSSSANLQELYVSPANSDTWGEDILGIDVLAVGEQGAVTIADGESVCAYDLQLVMDSGATLEGTADLCETRQFTITD